MRKFFFSIFFLTWINVSTTQWIKTDTTRYCLNSTFQFSSRIKSFQFFNCIIQMLPLQFVSILNKWRGRAENKFIKKWNYTMKKKTQRTAHKNVTHETILHGCWENIMKEAKVKLLFFQGWNFCMSSWWI